MRGLNEFGIFEEEHLKKIKPEKYNWLDAQTLVRKNERRAVRSTAIFALTTFGMGLVLSSSGCNNGKEVIANNYPPESSLSSNKEGEIYDDEIKIGEVAFTTNPQEALPSPTAEQPPKPTATTTPTAVPTKEPVNEGVVEASPKPTEEIKDTESVGNNNVVVTEPPVEEVAVVTATPVPATTPTPVQTPAPTPAPTPQPTPESTPAVTPSQDLGATLFNKPIEGTLTPEQIKYIQDLPYIGYNNPAEGYGFNDTIYDYKKWRDMIYEDFLEMFKPDPNARIFVDLNTIYFTEWDDCIIRWVLQIEMENGDTIIKIMESKCFYDGRTPKGVMILVQKDKEKDNVELKVFVIPHQNKD